MDKDCEECLGELFSTQKIKVEELGIKLEELNKIHKEEIETLLEAHSSLQESTDQMIEFIRDLRKLPPKWCWATTYSTKVRQFLKDRGL